jgi:hypothetical protein
MCLTAYMRALGGVVEARVAAGIWQIALQAWRRETHRCATDFRREEQIGCRVSLCARGSD